MTAYTASKHGLLGLTRSLALETARQGITVNAICPGYVDDERTRENARIMAGKTGKSTAEILNLFAASAPQNRLIAPAEVAVARRPDRLGKTQRHDRPSDQCRRRRGDGLSMANSKFPAQDSMLPFLEPDHLILRERTRRWVEDKGLSFSRHHGNLAANAIALVRELGAGGFLKHAVPEEFGGTRATVQARDLCVLREELARADALADTMFAMQALGSYPISLAGNREQKSRLLPAIARGECIAAFAITEPDAGSDVASLQTRAERHGNEFRLTGTKRFISNAGIADNYVVFAATAPEKKAKGISAFLLAANTPGLFLKEKIELLAPHPIGVIEFADCVVDEDALLGKEGGRTANRLCNSRSLEVQRRRRRGRLGAESFRRSGSIQQNPPAVRPAAR